MACVHRFELPRAVNPALHSDDLPDLRIFERLGMRVAGYKGAECF